MRLAPTLLALAVSLVAGCKDPAKDRAAKAASADTFWPEAPKPTKTDGKHALLYKPESFTGYLLTVDVKTLPRAAAKITAAFELGFSLEATEDPRTRAAKLTKLDLDVDAQGQGMRMKLEGQELVIVENRGEPLRIKRGDPSPLAIAEILDKPFTMLKFGADNTITTEGNPDNPFTALGGDFLETALVLFPDLPAEPIASGHTWTIKRNVPLGSGMGRIDVTYDLVFRGVGACPSGKPSCALISFTAASADQKVHEDGIDLVVTYGFAGKIFFDTERGAIDESRIRMDLDVDAGKIEIPMAGTYVLRPSAS